MQVSWRERALDNLEVIRDYIAEDNKFYASVFVERVFEKVDLLMEQPRMGKYVPEYENESIRQIVHKGYRIIYEIFDGEIYIIAVVHGSRKLDFKERP